MGCNAPADSLLGQLQRGRGMGFLRALQADAIVVHPLLLECLTHDPRWDQQVESRSEYYAALIMRVGLPLAPLDEYLHTLPDAGQLALTTLCALVVRGYAAAAPLLRAYLAYGEYGEYWEIALEALIDARSPAVDAAEVSHLLDLRFPDDDALDDALPVVGPGMHTRNEPWRSLRAINPRVERVLSEHEREAEQRQRAEEQERAALIGGSASQLIAHADRTNWRLAAKALQLGVTAADLDLLLDAAQQGDLWQRCVAFRGLQTLADPAALPILRAFFESPDTRSGLLYGAAARAITALPPEVTLDLARAWFDAPDGAHRHVALQILEAHATAADVSRVRAALISSLLPDSPESNECYMRCDILEILARFPESGPYPEVETVFMEADYSFTRARAAEVLRRSAPDRFAHGPAYECLWDCEARVRLTGCEGSATIARARARIQEMARDPYEDEEVRAAAAKRLERDSEEVADGA